jgi:chitinase
LLHKRHGKWEMANGKWQTVMRHITSAICLLPFAMLLARSAPAASGKWITAHYSAQNGVESVSDIPWSKLTHLNHFAAAPGLNGTVAIGYLSQSEINALIAARPNGKKVLVVIADAASWTPGGTSFADATSSTNIVNFVNNVISFVNTNGYDGVDFDWEQNVVVSQYEDLLARVRTALPSKTVTIDSGNWGGLETVAGASYANIDQINLMCYDMDNTGSYAWHNDALFQNGDASKSTCDWRVRAFTNVGVPNAKIGIGIPYYGRRWTGVTQPLQTGGTMQPNGIGYNTIVTDPTRWQPAYQKWDATYSADYLSVTGLNEFVSYNGTTSIQGVVTWVNAQGFGGYMVFALHYEFLASQTGDARYPLSTALWQDVNGTPPTSACDVNGDGVVNVVDVQLEVNMALGLSPCTNPSGTCTVVSVQRVVNAALGGSCVNP